MPVVVAQVSRNKRRQAVQVIVQRRHVISAVLELNIKVVIQLAPAFVGNTNKREKLAWL